MKPGRIVIAVLGLLGLVALGYTGAWQTVLLFAYQHPLLTWLPLLAGVAVAYAAGLARERLQAEDPPPGAPRPAAPAPYARPEPTEAGRLTLSLPRPHVGAGAVIAVAVFLSGLLATLAYPSDAILEDLDYDRVATLPATTQPRLLPRTAVRDDPRFADAKEIHLVRDPASGGLLWTGEWQAGTLSGPSRGIAVKRLDELVGESAVVPAGFDRAASGFGPSGVKWKARLRHPLSRTQYPVIVPTGERTAFAVLPYVGYRGFPLRHQYLKGVLVYHQDGRVEDLTPEEAARRPELARTGRLYPEGLARKVAEALARTDELEGEIVDGEDNRQPYLTALDRERAVWVTIINEKGRAGAVKALVFTDSTTGRTTVWKAPAGMRMVSTQDVVDQARALPLRFSERRCCDSDGHSYTVKLREVVEPRLAFKDGTPYYMVSVVPTRELAIGREIEHTLLIDARTGERIDQFRHAEGGRAEDARLQAFFADDR